MLGHFFRWCPRAYARGYTLPPADRGLVDLLLTGSPLRQLQISLPARFIFGLRDSFFFTLALYRFPFPILLHRCIMTRRRLFLSNVRRVAIGAVARLLELTQFVFDGQRLWISSFLAVAMTTGACVYRYVGS